MQYIEKYNRWISSSLVDEDTKKELGKLSKQDIKECFYSDLEFGTGGLRGVMAAGTNRMNVYTIRLTTQGVAQELLDNGEEFSKKGVVIAYDSRNNSELFAKETAKVFLGNGIKTYLFSSLRPTPELSFALRYLGCARGVVITASHNPKEYNGYKVYAEDGGQITPETAKKITRYIRNTDIFDDIKISSEKPQMISEEIDRAYIEAVKDEGFLEDIKEDLKVVYTPLHGAGCESVKSILYQIGVKNLFVVPEQEKPCGDFPTVKSPNPENPEAFDISVKYAKEIDADLIIGTDPDSDRVGVVIKDRNGEYITLNGNQTGCILTEYILRKSKEKGLLTSNSTVVKTIVTTEMVRAIADDYSIKTCDVLTGFKYIGDKIKLFEEEGNAERFVFGLEESFGYLKGSYARDKDAVVAAMLMCEAAADYNKRGMSVYEGLEELYKKYGYFKEELETITFEGIDGEKKIKELMQIFRNEEIPFKVTEKLDYLEGIDGLPVSDVLKFKMENAWVAVRPSGTEPKIKFYFGVYGKDKVLADEEMKKIKYFFLKKANI